MRTNIFTIPLCLLILIIYSQNAIAQGIGINNDNSNPDGSAMLHVKSTTKGILVPRMSTAQRTAIPMPATGLLVFDLTSNSFWFFNGSIWTELIAGIDNDHQDLNLAGNILSLTNDGTTVNLTPYLDNTDNQTLTYSGNTLSITNGNSINLPNGDITGVTAGDGLIGGGTTGSPTLHVVAINGLTDNANDVRLGGALIQQTTINQGSNNMNFNLNGSGNFNIQDNGVNHFTLSNNGNAIFGGNTTWNSGSTNGFPFAALRDNSSNAYFELNVNGNPQHLLNTIGTTTFNRLGFDSDFNVNGTLNNNLLFVDAGTNRVGIGTGSPAQRLHVIGTTRISTLAGSGNRMVVANASGDLTTQTIPTTGITNITAGDGLTGGGSGGAITLNVLANNGLTDYTDEVRLGGTLLQNTSINQGAYNMNYNLNSTGDFHIQDAGVNHFSVMDNGDASFGSDVYWRDENTTGTILARLSDSGDDGILDIFSNGSIQHRINSIGTTVFNEQGTSSSDVRIESNLDANMLFVDASTNKIGVRKNTPTHVLDIEDTKSSASGATVRVANKLGGGLNYQNGPAMVIEIPNIGYGERNVSGLFFNRMRENVEWVVGTEGGAFGSAPAYPAPSTEKFFISRSLKTTNAHRRVRPIYSNNTYFVINNNGTVGLGLTNPTYKLTLPNNSTANTGQGRAFAWSTYSDGRLKTNRKPIAYGLNEIMQIEALSYDHHNSIFLDQNEDREFASIEILASSSNQIGFIAQDLVKIIPEAVTPPENEESDLWGVDYTRLIPVLVKATQEQQKTIESLQSENKSLLQKEKNYQNKIQQLERQINRIEVALQKNNLLEDK